MAMPPPSDWFEHLGGITPIHGPLYRSPIPSTAAHFRQMRGAGIRVVFSFEESVPGHLARAEGLDWRPHFWTDDVPPEPAQVDAFLDEFLALPEDARVLMHCRAGWGRAGTALTCALVARYGWSAQQALTHYWQRVPRAEGVMRANGQADFVRGHAARLRGRGIP